jgi:hypothetical protein
MTAQPPSDPPPSRRPSLDFDEFIAVIVAFTTLGAVLAWGLTRDNGLFNQSWLPSLNPTESPAASGVFPNTASNTAPNPDSTPQPIFPVPGATTNADPNQGQVIPVPDRTSRTAVVPVPVPIDPTIAQPEATPQPAETPVPQGAAVSQATPSPNAVTFPDVPANYWAYPFITALIQRGDLSGFPDGTFRPDQPVTRAEFAAMIQNTFPQTKQQAPLTFPDVPSSYWAAPAIDTAVQTGFLKGYPEGLFQPNQQIPTVQALVALTNGLRLAAPANPDQVMQLFRDRDQIPAYAVPSTAAAAQSGLVVNYPNPDILSPNQPASRAQVAAMLYQALVATGQAAPISSNYIVRP